MTDSILEGTGATETAGPIPSPHTSQSLVSRWREVLRTSNPPAGRLDPVSRWLVLTRAAVLPMTITAGAVAGLLAVGQDGFRPALLALAIAGIVLAQMS